MGRLVARSTGWTNRFLSWRERDCLNKPWHVFNGYLLLGCWRAPVDDEDSHYNHHMIRLEAKKSNIYQDECVPRFSTFLMCGLDLAFLFFMLVYIDVPATSPCSHVSSRGVNEAKEPFSVHLFLLWCIGSHIGDDDDDLPDVGDSF